jgi:hypothetical protein
VNDEKRKKKLSSDNPTFEEEQDGVKKFCLDSLTMDGNKFSD